MITNLNSLYGAEGRTPATLTTPAGAGALQGVSVKQTGTQSPTVITRRSAPVAPTTSVPTSVFPQSIDSFRSLALGTVSQPSDFTSLSAAIEQTQKTLSTLVKAAPNDIAERLTGRTSTGQSEETMTTGGIRLLGGVASSAVRSPIITSLSCSVYVSSGLSSIYVDTALSTEQIATLGIGSTWASAGGIGVVTSAKMQVSYADPSTLPIASFCGILETRLDNGGAVRLMLHPHAAATNTLAPGLWFLHVLFIRSAYSW